MNHRTLGRMILIEYYGCSEDAINDKDKIREAMIEAAKRAKATIVADVFHRFNPHGISGVVVIAESHLAIHTWPEHRCASVDIFSCSPDLDAAQVEAFLKDVFQAERSERVDLERGRVPGSPLGIQS